MNDAAAEITSGLEAGQQVILAPDTNLTHGRRIKPIPRSEPPLVAIPGGRLPQLFE